MIDNIRVRQNAFDDKFRNNADFCVGTGRMGLALHAEYLKQLERVQEEIGFSCIRGHGLLSDDMAIYQYRDDEEGNRVVEYNFTYLDRVLDSYIELGLRPFLELGFMPNELASGIDTVFYWKGNITPPKSYGDWRELIKAVLSHLIERYGRDDVTGWLIEVWNEPNLPGFWKDADMAEYFRLFEETFRAVKAVDEALRVGGPAICGVDDERWMRGFLDFCRDRGIRPDFITRHHYTCEISRRSGHYVYPKISEPDLGRKNLLLSREIIDSYDEFRGLPMHITEFSTSWYPRNVIHDTNFNAAYIAGQLSWLGDMCESYSYWTFGDVFEETGVPFSMFHGGFGLVANGGVEKPTFRTFVFYKRLKECGERCAFRSDSAVIMTKRGGGYLGVLWRYGKDGEALDLRLLLDAPNGEYSLVTETVDPEVCNPLKAWHDLGEPKTPTKAQLKIIKSAAQPLIRTARLKAENGVVNMELRVNDSGVVYFELTPSALKSDRGYDYSLIDK